VASEVDICNVALSHIAQEGVVASINPPDGSAEAGHCKRFYPIARGVVLESHDWGFATVRASIAELDNPLDSWAFCYAWPSDCLRPLRVLLPEATSDGIGETFITEALSDGTKVIYTNVEDATLVYTRLVTDTGKYSALFTDCVAWLLAHYLAGPITKDPKIVESCYKIYVAQLGFASSKDATAKRTKPRDEYVPSSIAART